MEYYIYAETTPTVDGQFYWAVHNKNIEDDWDSLEANGYEDSIPNALYAAYKAVINLEEENSENN